MKQCQYCGNPMPSTAIGFYCPKCSDIISEKNEKQKLKDLEIKKEQDLRLIEKGYNPDVVDAFFKISMWHIFGSPIFILCTIPNISSEQYWYWIIGVWEAIYWGNLWFAEIGVYNKFNLKYDSGFFKSDVIALKIINYIFGIYVLLIAIYYCYMWYIKQ